MVTVSILLATLKLTGVIVISWIPIIALFLTAFAFQSLLIYSRKKELKQMIEKAESSNKLDDEELITALMQILMKLYIRQR